jgi:hypothetical protein
MILAYREVPYRFLLEGLRPLSQIDDKVRTTLQLFGVIAHDVKIMLIPSITGCSVDPQDLSNNAD